ncbi:MAG: hypothetical protein IKR92_01420 [Alphaproteobacteria bacterium]|nr:hypothetical protein [Alphaproteobacteria bacterium]
MDKIVIGIDEKKRGERGWCAVLFERRVDKATQAKNLQQALNHEKRG